MYILSAQFRRKDQNVPGEGEPCRPRRGLSRGSEIGRLQLQGFTLKWKFHYVDGIRNTAWYIDFFPFYTKPFGFKIKIKNLVLNRMEQLPPPQPPPSTVLVSSGDGHLPSWSESISVPAPIACLRTRTLYAFSKAFLRSCPCAITMCLMTISIHLSVQLFTQ